MCYGDDARPPAPPVQGPVGDHGDTVLTSADGTRFGAYEAHPAVPSGTGMVILPDVRGLHDFYRELTQRFAEAGMHSVAIDYFGRSAGIGPRGEDFPFREHVEQMDFARVDDDVAAAVAHLKTQSSVESVFTVGFCMGGALSWVQSASDHGLSGCIGFYGQPSRVLATVPQMKAPLLILAAGQDFTPVEEVREFAAKAREAGVGADLYVYPDAPHSFFDRTFAQHRADCADAWQRMLAFVGHSVVTPD